MEQQFDSWQRGIRRISMRVSAGFCLMVVVLQTRSLVVGVGHDAQSITVTVAEIALLLPVAARGWRAGLGMADLGACVVLLAVAAAVGDPSVDPAATGGDGNPAFLFMAATLLLCIVVLRGNAVPVAIVLVTGVYLAASVLLGGRALGASLDETVLLATTQSAIWLVFRELEQEADRADHAHLRAISEQGVAARSTAEQHAVLEARRTLHDRVLTALLLLANATADKLPALRAECREAAGSIEALGARSVGAGADTTDVQLHRRLQVEAAAAAAPTGVKARVRHRPAPQMLPLPGPVGDAMSGAVAEALRNVGRHAGVGEADVVVTASTEGGVLVEVVDRGRGLPAGSAAGFGLQHSVDARLRDVGGTAQIDASPDGGTHVRLRWSPLGAPEGQLSAPDSGSDAELTRIAPRPRTFALSFAVTLLVGALYLALRYPSTSAWGDLAVVSVVLAYIAGCVAAIPHPKVLRAFHHAGLAILPGALAAGLYVAGAGSLRSFDSWVVGLASLPVLLLAMVRPAVPVLVLALLESAVVMTAAVVDPIVTPFEVLAPVAQTPTYAALMVWGIAAIGRLRSSATRDEERAVVALARTQAVRTRRRAMETHYAWLARDVRPFLDAVADGHLDPADAAVQQRSSILALAVGDELAAPTQLSDAVRGSIAAARRRGTRVDVRAGDEWSSTPARAELEQVLRVLTASDAVAQITVSLPQRDSSRLRVVVRPGLSPSQRRALLGSTALEIDEDDLVSIITIEPFDRSDHDR